MGNWIRRRFRFIVVILTTPVIAVAVLAATFYGLDVMYPFPADRVAEALDGGGSGWRMDADGRWRFPVETGAVSPHLIRATIAAEDKRFWEHGGVDAAALAVTAARNMFYGRRISEGRTITMHAVRHLLQDGETEGETKGGILRDMFRAVQMERLFGKEAVLAVYFSQTPYGGNIVGVEAAAKRYFGKSADDLSLGEAALLAGLPRSPERLDPRRHPDAARRRRWQVLDCMLNDGFVELAEATRAGKERLNIFGMRTEEELERYSRILAAASSERAGITVSPVQTTASRGDAGALPVMYIEGARQGFPRPLLP